METQELDAPASPHASAEDPVVIDPEQEAQASEDNNIDADVDTDMTNNATPVDATMPSADGVANASASGSQSSRAAGLNSTTATGDDSAKEEAAQRPELLESRIPAKKDATLREFLGKMDDYAPIIPDAITAHYLTLAGLPPPPETPLPLARLLALATQKFVADIAADAYQYARIRTGHTTSNTAAANAATLAGLPGGAVPGMPGQAPAEVGGGKAGKDKGGQLGVQRPGYGGGGQGGAGQGRTVLTMEDLGCAVGEYGVNIKRGEFYR